MDTVIVGGGRVGEKVSKRLSRTRHKVSVVEIDEETVHQLRKRLDEPLIVHGDGTKREVLREAGIEESESLIASTSNDETNLLICKTAKSSFSCRVITRVIKDEYTDLYKDIGTDVVVSDISATVGLLEKAAASNGLYGMITMGGKEGDVIEVDVADGSTADGSSIEDLDFPDLCTVGLIRRDSNLIPPRGDTVFEKGDQVVLVGKSEELISSIELFRTE